jgi:hypothetical protein
VGDRSVFISYKRQLSWSLALLIRNDLVKHGFDTFMDDENLDSGAFERTILSQIEAREHFVVLLQPGSLDQISENGDWLRREIAYALAHGRNVVPVTVNGFELRRDLMLPSDVAGLPSFTAVPIHQAYFDAAMERLRTRFLKMPSNPKAPLLLETGSVVEPGRQALARSGEHTSAGPPTLPAPQLTGHGGNSENPIRVELTWSEVSGADEYVVERARPQAPQLRYRQPFLEVYRGPDRSYGEAPGSTNVAFWRYRVRATASGQVGRWSDELVLRTGFGM